MKLRFARNELMCDRKPFPNSLRDNFVSTSKRSVVLISRASLYRARQQDWRLYDGL